MSDVTIDCGNGNNGDTDVNTGDHVTFHNDLNNKSITLNLPEKGGSSCFSGNPGSSDSIPAGGNSTQYTISSNANGTYDYSWTIEGDASLAPRTGRIVVE